MRAADSTALSPPPAESVEPSLLDVVSDIRAMSERDGIEFPTVAFVSPDHLVAVEIKSEYDDTSRLMNQAGMFRLAVPELWIVAPHRHTKDVELIRYLMPSIGSALSDRDRPYGPLPSEFELEDIHPAAPFQPVPEACLSLLWVAELHAEASRARVIRGAARRSHGALVAAMLTLTWPEHLAAVCRQIRARNAFWRADPPIVESQHD